MLRRNGSGPPAYAPNCGTVLTVSSSSIACPHFCPLNPGKGSGEIFLPMRIALRDLSTGLFFTKGLWVKDSRVAQHFPDEKALEKTVLENNVNNAEMVFLEEENLRPVGGRPVPYPPSHN